MSSILDLDDPTLTLVLARLAEDGCTLTLTPDAASPVLAAAGVCRRFRRILLSDVCTVLRLRFRGDDASSGAVSDHPVLGQLRNLRALDVGTHSKPSSFAWLISDGGSAWTPGRRLNVHPISTPLNTLLTAIPCSSSTLRSLDAACSKQNPDLLSICEFKGLRQLALTWHRKVPNAPWLPTVPSDTWRQLGTLQHLTALALMHGMSAPSLSALPEPEDLANLASLTLGHQPDVVSHVVEYLSRMTALTTLQLISCGTISAAPTAAVPGVRQLHLDGARVEQTVLEALLTSLPGLEALNLVRIHEVRMAWLECLAQLPRLKRLALWAVSGTADAGALPVARFAGLRSLQVGNMRSQVDGALAAATGLRLLSFVSVSQSTHDVVPRLLQLTALRGIDLRQCASFADEHLEQLCAALPLLEVLILAVCRLLTPRSLHVLAARERLRGLDVSGIPNINLDHLKTLAPLPRLEHLAMPTSGVDDGDGKEHEARQGARSVVQSIADISTAPVWPWLLRNGLQAWPYTAAFPELTQWQPAIAGPV